MTSIMRRQNVCISKWPSSSRGIWSATEIEDSQAWNAISHRFLWTLWEGSQRHAQRPSESLYQSDRILTCTGGKTRHYETRIDISSHQGLLTWWIDLSGSLVYLDSCVVVFLKVVNHTHIVPSLCVRLIDSHSILKRLQRLVVSS